MIKQLDTENADVDISQEYALVLTDIPDVANPTECQVLLLLGDGAKDLDVAGGTYIINIHLGSQSGFEEEFVVTATDIRVGFWSKKFPVPANTEVKVYLYSPLAADTDIDVTAYLYDVDPLSVLPSAELTTVATTIRGFIIQTWRRFFKRATQTATELKTYKDDNVSVVTTQTVSDDDTTETQGPSS